MKPITLKFKLEGDIFYIQDGILKSENKDSEWTPIIKQIWKKNIEEYSVSFGSLEYYFFEKSIKPLGGILIDFLLQDPLSTIV